MSLDLGAVVARVVVEDAEFQRMIARDIGLMKDFGAQASGSAAGTAKLDEGLVAVAASASRASTALGRGAKSAAEIAAADQKAAASAERHAAAEDQLAVVMGDISAMSAREQRAVLGLLAAHENLARVEGSQTATLMSLARAQAAVIGADDRLTAAQNAAATAAEREAAAMRAAAASSVSAAETTAAATGRFAGLVKTAAELGLVIGGIELVKKASEFVMAGKDLTSSLNSVQAAAHATDAAMVPVRAQVIGLGHDLTVPRATAVDAAAAIDDLVRSGMTLPRAMAAARSALLLASVSQTDMALTARVLGDALDEFQLPASQAAHVATLLGAAATSTAGGLETVFDALRYAGTRARAAKIPMNDLLASIVDLSKAGLQGTTIGTGLAMMISRLSHESAPGAKALADLGINAWDAQGRFKGLPFVIDAVSQAGKRFGPNSHQFLADLTVAFGARAANIMAAFAGKGIEGVDRFENRLNSFNLQDAANKMNRGFGAAMGQIEKQLTALGIDFYQKVEPALSSAAMWLGTSVPHAITVLAQILGPTVHMIGTGLVGAWHAAGAVLGPVVTGLGAVGHVLAEHSGLISHVIAPLLAMWAAWKGYQIALVAGRAITAAVSNIGALMARGALAVQGYGQGVAATFAGNATAAERGALIVTANNAKVEAAVAQEAAAVDRAAAMEAVANADKVASSSAATDSQVADADKVAAAALAQARTSQAAATQTVLAADEAAAGVSAAGDTAAIGWSAMLGPLALVGVGIGALTMAFGSDGAAAQKNAAEIDSLTSSIKSNSGAISDDTRALVSHALQQAGALDAARKLGLSLGDVTDAALGNAAAQLTVSSATTKYAAVTRYAYGGMTKQQKELADAADTVNGALGDQTSAVGSAVHAAKNEMAANKGAATSAVDRAKATANLGVVFGNVAQATHLALDTSGNFVQITGDVAKASDAATKALDAQTTASKQLKLAQDLLNGVHESLETSTDALSIAVGNLANKTSLATDASGNASTSLKQNTVAGATNRQMLVGLIDAAKTQAQATADQAYAHTHQLGPALLAGNRQLAANENAIRRAASAAGLDKGETDKLISSLGILSKVHPDPKVDVNTAPAQAKAAAIQAQINDFRQTHKPVLDADPTDALHHIADIQNGLANLHDKDIYINVIERRGSALTAGMRATGGYGTGASMAAHYAGMVVGPGTGTSDTAGVFRLSAKEFVSTAASVARNAGALEAGNRGATLVAIDGMTRKLIASSARASVPVRAPMAVAAPSGAGMDLSPLTSRLDAIERRLAEVPERTGAAVGAATLDGYRAAGASAARQNLRNWRGGPR